MLEGADMKTHFHSGAEVTKLSDDDGSGSDRAIIGYTNAMATKDLEKSEESFEHSVTSRSSFKCINVSRSVRRWRREE